MSKHSSTLQIQKKQEILSLARSIIANPSTLIQFENSTTIVSTLDKPTVRSTFKENTEVAFGIVRILVDRFLDSFAFSTKLNENQKMTLVSDFLDRFSYESLLDIVLFMKMARNGYFGAATHSVDSNLIFGNWFPQYLDLKSQQRELEWQKEKSLNNKLSTDDAVSNFYRKKREEKEKKQREEQMKKYIDDAVSHMDKQMLEDTISDWVRKPEMHPYLNYLKQKRTLF